METIRKNGEKTMFCLIRHGATDWEKGVPRLEAHEDLPLNSDGINQARELARKLKKHKWELLFTSDLKRARDTAAIISEKLKIPLVLRPELRERNHGILTGKSISPGADKVNFLSKASGREPLGKFIRRVRSFGLFLHKHRKHNVLVVSHGGFLRTFAAVLLMKQKQHWGNAEILMAPYEAIGSQAKRLHAPKTPPQGLREM